MLIIDAREAESIDKALKNYKKKFEGRYSTNCAGASRSQSPLLSAGTEILKAEYRQQMQSKED